MEALARGYLVRYTTLDDLVRHLRKADALGKLASKLTQLQRPHLLVLDLRRHRNYADVRFDNIRDRASEANLPSERQ